jgi:hypothetical protein
MIISVVVVVACIIVYAACKAFNDKATWHWHRFRWNHNVQLDPSESWRNKWQLNHNGDPIPATKAPFWYFGLHTPDFKERFPYSSTILVQFTDAWHLVETVKAFAVCVPLLFLIPGWWSIIAFAVARFVVYPVIFHLLFHWLLED